MTDRTRNVSGRFVVDGSYLRAQAKDAVRTFVAPLSVVYDTAAGIVRDASHADVKKSPSKSMSGNDHAF